MDFLKIRLLEGINEPLQKLQNVYKRITVMQGDSMATAPSRWVHSVYRIFPFEHILVDVSLSMCFCNLRELQKELSGHFITCTKEDTMMNVWLVRARSNSQFPELACLHSNQSLTCHSCRLCWYVLFFDVFCSSRKWRPPETEEQKQEKKKKAEDAKRRKKDKSVKEE